MEETAPDNVKYRLLRDAGNFKFWFAKKWQSLWFRRAIYALSAFLVFLIIFWALFVRNLPDADQLVDYEPALPTTVRDNQGEIFHRYARDRRVQLEYGDFPKMLVNAYLSAEDKTFFSHGGIDYPGIISAVISNLSRDGRSVGASTITQQVAKNLLLTNEYSYSRKIKEAILAKRIESALSKEEILTLYLNEIPLGRRSFGVEAAAQAYFGKSVDELQLHEMAFLAILPKSPETYGRAKYEKRALERRNWVLNSMAKNGFITQRLADEASARPLGLGTGIDSKLDNIGAYYSEEVRRQLMEQFGEKAEDGPYSVYAGGLWVRTSMDRKIQISTTNALRDGLMRYHGSRGYYGPLGGKTIDMAKGSWASQLAAANMDLDYRDWRVGVYLGGGEVGFSTGKTGKLISSSPAVKAGDIIAVSPAGGNGFALRIVPEIGGGMVVQNPLSGRVLAMQGGFDFSISSLNRATQAKRQPGSTIKPFVYATAIDQGMTPATIIEDATFCVWQSSTLGRKCFRNFGGSRGAGPRTMRWGLEQSRNLMTVRAAHEAGMDNVTRTFREMNIGDYPAYLSMALGAGDTTVLNITNAYSMLVNHGRQLKPTLIDYVQDRRGKVIWPEKWKPCKGCNMKDWNGGPMPRFKPVGKQVMDPVTAFQVVHMLEGVVQRGTATILKDLDRPIFGKTGTTSGPTNVWFVGGTPQMVSGVYLGFDQLRNMGGYAQGGSLAAPIFKQMAKEILPDYPVIPFTAPEGTRLVRIDRQTGRRVFGAWPADNGGDGSVIWEAFKPDTEPKRSIRTEEIEARSEGTGKVKKNAVTAPKAAAKTSKPATSSTERDRQFIQEEGGIY
ncbi:penicillin-binding protein [Sphingorhabdus lutea]|uniref:peptidoglycan glycosyltransferase n=1 Tax=Sphingorhabdus lutea TaxID=1913578 RepID=A0A1L3JEQ0_9SPHN|nr:penicillin-binding protein [Sphingorhabdus lutea]